MPVFQRGETVDIEPWRTPMSRFNTIVWNSASVEEIRRPRPAAAHSLPQLDVRRPALADSLDTISAQTDSISSICELQQLPV